MTNSTDTLFSPEQFVEEVAAALPRSSETEKSRLLEHARAWATVSYPEQIPAKLDMRLTQLEEQWQSRTN